MNNESLTFTSSKKLLYFRVIDYFAYDFINEL